MATEVKLPRLGQGMEAGTIVRWLKAEGETVAKGEPLYELDTEKVTQEVEAEVAGTVLLKIVASERRRRFPSARSIAMIGDPSEKPRRAGRLPRRSHRKHEPPPAPGAAQAPCRCRSRRRRRGRSAPAAGSRHRRSRAASRGSAASSSPTSSAPAPTGGSSPRTSSVRPRASPGRTRTRTHGPGGRALRASARAAAIPAMPVGAATVVPLTSMRRVIARRMSEAWQAPHFVVSMTADMRKVMKLREKLVERTLDGAAKPTFSDVITKRRRAFADARIRRSTRTSQATRSGSCRPRTSAWPSPSTAGSSCR